MENKNEMTFINLTNGIEAIIRHGLLGSDYHFIRVQSTACEQKRWNFIIHELDYCFLMALALGKHCTIYDFGAHSSIPRALWQGLTWVEYVLNRFWLKKEIPIKSRGGISMLKYFSECYEKLDTRAIQKLTYFKKFLNTREIKLTMISQKTNNDGDYKYYKTLLDI